MLLEIARFWASIASYDHDLGPLRDPRGDGPRRVPRRLPRPRRTRPGQQRLHQRDGRLGAVPGPGDPGPAARPPPDRAGRAARAGPRGAGPLGGSQPQAARLLPRRRLISQFEGYGDLAELDWDGLPAPLRQHPPPGPDPGGRGRLPQPLQGLQAGRRADAVLPAVGRRAAGAAGPARLPAASRTPSPATSTTTCERTSHGSTLCGVVNAWVLARSDRQRSWRFFAEALAPTSTTSRAAPPPRASTSAPWPVRSTSPSAATPAWRPARTCSGSTPACPRSWTDSTSTSVTAATGASTST